MRKPTFFSSKKGFTLVELLVVFAFIGIVVVVILLVIDPARRFAEARNAERHQNVEALAHALKLYAVDNKTDSLPLIDGTLRMLGTAGAGCSVACEPDEVVATFPIDEFFGVQVAEAKEIDRGELFVGSGTHVLEARNTPAKVVPGDTMHIETTLRDEDGIDMVLAHIGELVTVELELSEGTKFEGVWKYDWLVERTEYKNYTTELEIINTKGENTFYTLFWSDPPESGWILPTGYIDAGNQWNQETQAFDGNSGSYAQNTFGGVGWGEFIEFTLDAATTSNRLRLKIDYDDARINEVDIDVFTGGAWVDVFQGGDEATWNSTFVEVPFNKAEVEKARFRYNYAVGGFWYWVYEFQFYKTVDNVGVPECQELDATSIRESSAILQAGLVDDGGEPVEYRFEYGLTQAYGEETPWQSGAVSGDTLRETVVGLDGFTNYHFRGVIKNSTSTVYCDDRTFTTQGQGPGWVLPASFSDPDGVWENETNAFDDGTLTYARSQHEIGDPQWSSYIYLQYPQIAMDRVRFFARGLPEVDEIEVDVFKDGAWESVYSGAFNDKEWVEAVFAEGDVSEARVRFHAIAQNHGFFWELFELNFWKTGNNTERSNVTEEACIDLSPYLIPQYIAEIPYDPLVGTEERTQYAVRREFENRRISVVSCQPELGETIDAVR